MSIVELFCEIDDFWQEEMNVAPSPSVRCPSRSLDGPQFARFFAERLGDVLTEQKD
jgi:hypothetical protein